MRFLIPALFLFTSTAFSQVPAVYKEPMHQLVHMSPETRIMDVRAQPGDTSQFHRHASDICYVVLEGDDRLAGTG